MGTLLGLGQAVYDAGGSTRLGASRSWTRVDLGRPLTARHCRGSDVDTADEGRPRRAFHTCRTHLSGQIYHKLNLQLNLPPPAPSRIY